LAVVVPRDQRVRWSSRNLILSCRDRRSLVENVAGSAARMMPTASVIVSSIRENPARRCVRMQLAVRRVGFECLVGIYTFCYLPKSQHVGHVAGGTSIATRERKVAEGGVLRQPTLRTVWAQPFRACIWDLPEQQTKVLG